MIVFLTVLIEIDGKIFDFNIPNDSNAILKTNNVA